VGLGTGGLCRAWERRCESGLGQEVCVGLGRGGVRVAWERRCEWGLGEEVYVSGV
jgi:hypothetical protein